MKNPCASNLGKIGSLFFDVKKLLFLIVLFSCIFTLYAGPALAADLEVQSLPTASPTITPTNWYDCPLQGLYKQAITLSTGTTRDFYMYVPEGTQPNQSVVHILVPSGYTYNVDGFLVDSGWIQIADEEAVTLMIECAADGAWGSYADEYSYLNETYTFLTKRPFIDVRKHNMYLAAYGDAANIGAEFAAKKPEYFAGILAVGSSGMSQALCDELAATDSAFKDPQGDFIALHDVIYPVWIVSENKTADVSRMIDFYVAANKDETSPSASDLADEFYAPDEAAFAGDAENEAVAGVYFSEATIDSTIDYDYTLSVWKNMFECIRRYPSFGEVRSYIPSDEDPLFERYDATVDGYSRFWYVYEPESVQGKTDVPVVFVFHGNGGGPTEITDQTGWKVLADELGVILVAPQGSASWGSNVSTYDGIPYYSYTTSWTTSASATRPNDLLFIDHIYNWLLTSENYDVDSSRIYATGQSMGGSNTVNMITYRPQYFAAAAACSWVSTPGASAVTNVDIPVMTLMGQNDSTVSGGLSKSSGSTQFAYYLDRYDLTEKGDLNRTYGDFTFMTENPICTDKDGMLNKYEFETAKGYPMFVGVEVVGMAHATVPTEVSYIWDYVFSHYTRDPVTQILYYDGNLVDTQANMALYGALNEAGGTMQTLPSAQTADGKQALQDLLKNADGKYEDYYQVVYDGYFDLPMVLSSKPYDLRMYIPDGSRYSQSSVLLVVPSNTDPYEFMVQSGWKQVADEDKVTIFMLMPNRVKDNGGVATAWGSWSSYQYSELSSYITGAVDVIGQRPGIQTVSYCEYIIGYGDAADLVTKYVMNNPTTFAGAFSVGSTGAGSELIAGLQTAASKETGVTKSEVSIPFGIVSDGNDVSAVVNYFKSANSTVSVATANGSFAYYAPDTAAQVGQPDSEPVAGVYTKNASAAACTNYAFASEVYDIFNTVRRYPGYGNGELRAYEDVYTSDNYKYYTSLTALGDYTYGGDISKPGDGEYYNREWFVYVPDSAKAKMDGGQKVEVLFLFMGSNGYGDEIAQRTGWDDIAQQEGFIIVSPSGYVRHQGNFGNYDRNGVNCYQYCTFWSATSAENIPNDLIMVDDIYGWLFNDSEFAGKLDQSRVFASGQSYGGYFTHAVAENRPQYFAAAASCSWVSTGAGADISNDVAIMTLMGQKDTTVSGGLGTGNAQKMFDNYIARYGNLSDSAGRDAWSDFTFMKEPSGGTSVYTANGGAYNTLNEYILKTENGYPMFVGVEVQNMTHATIPDECTFIWDTMFSHFSKDASTCILYYDGNIVDTPANEKLALAQENNPEMSYTTQTIIVDGKAYLSLFVKNAPNLNAISFDMDLPSGITYDSADIISGGTIALSGNTAAIFWPQKMIDATDTTLVAVLEFNVTANGTAGLAQIEVGQYLPLQDSAIVKSLNPISVTYVAAGSAAELYDIGGNASGGKDGVVNTADLSLLAMSFMARTGDAEFEAEYDFNCDGVIDILDITDLLIHFGGQD